MNNLFKQLPTLSTLLNQSLKNNLPLLAPFVRGKKVAKAGSARNRRRTTPGKFRRLYVEDGEWVEADHLLVRQLGLEFYPGENVIFCDNNSLKSRLAGHVLITLEKLSPYPDSPLYNYVSAGNTVERKFVHVISPPRKANYKLVDTI